MRKGLPLRANHVVATPLKTRLSHQWSSSDQKLGKQVVDLYHELEIPIPQNQPLLDTLLLPSEKRVKILISALALVVPDLEAEIEVLQPLPKISLEEIRYKYLLDLCHDVGILDTRDLDVKKIKGEVSVEIHLQFWFKILDFVAMMKRYGETAEEIVQPMPSEAFSLMVTSFGELRAADQEPHQIEQEHSMSDLKKLEEKFMNKLREFEEYLEEQEEEECQDLPDHLIDETVMMKTKLLMGNLKDLVDSYLVIYDSNLRYIVESMQSPRVDPEFVSLLRKVADGQTTAVAFVSAAKEILRHLKSLVDWSAEFVPRAAAIEAANSQNLALGGLNAPRRTDRPRTFESLIKFVDNNNNDNNKQHQNQIGKDMSPATNS